MQRFTCADGQKIIVKVIPYGGGRALVLFQARKEAAMNCLAPDALLQSSCLRLGRIASCGQCRWRYSPSMSLQILSDSPDFNLTRPLLLRVSLCHAFARRRTPFCWKVCRRWKKHILHAALIQSRMDVPEDVPSAKPSRLVPRTL